MSPAMNMSNMLALNMPLPDMPQAPDISPLIGDMKSMTKGQAQLLDSLWWLEEVQGCHHR